MHKYIVQEADQITQSTLLLTLKRSETGPPFAFQPGQYAVINFYRKRRPSAVRCFSIVSSPTQQDILQFSMRTRGHFTKALSRLKPGDNVDVSGPFGGFVFDAQRDKHTVFMAGGIGITPFISMSRYAAATKADNKIDLLYSCQTQDDIPFLDELKQLEQANPHFKVTFVIADGPSDKLAGQRVSMGRISPELIDQVTTKGLINTTTFLICGPPPFMRGMTTMLKSKGVQSNYIMTEAFSQGPNRQTGKVKNWPVNMYVMTAAGLGVTSFIITVADMLKTLPPSSIFGSNSNIRREVLTNSRQADLDSLVNSLPAYEVTQPESNAVKQAIAAAASQQKPTTNTSTPSTTTTNKVSSPTPAPAPTPVPIKTTPPPCTTTQSGVSTC
jgi:ferredoxin-NADP reductase